MAPTVIDWVPPALKEPVNPGLTVKLVTVIEFAPEVIVTAALVGSVIMYAAEAVPCRLKAAADPLTEESTVTPPVVDRMPAGEMTTLPPLPAATFPKTRFVVVVIVITACNVSENKITLSKVIIHVAFTFFRPAIKVESLVVFNSNRECTRVSAS